MPMGFTWAMWGAQQRCHGELLRRSGLPETRRLRDGAHPPPLSEGPLHLAYVDNFAVFSHSAEEANRLRGRVLETVAKAGLIAREIADAAVVTDMLGHRIDGREGCVGVSPKRLWRLRDAIASLLRRGRC